MFRSNGVPGMLCRTSGPGPTRTLLTNPRASPASRFPYIVHVRSQYRSQEGLSMAISRRIRGHYLLVVRFSTDNGERQDVSPPILERTWCAGKSTVVRSRGVEQGVWQFDGRLNFARAVGGRIGRLTSLRSPVAMPLRRAAGRKSSDFGADVVCGEINRGSFTRC